MLVVSAAVCLPRLDHLGIFELRASIRERQNDIHQKLPWRRRDIRKISSALGEALADPDMKVDEQTSQGGAGQGVLIRAGSQVSRVDGILAMFLNHCVDDRVLEAFCLEVIAKDVEVAKKTPFPIASRRCAAVRAGEQLAEVKIIDIDAKISK